MYKKEFIIFISRLALLMLLLSTNVISEEVYKYKDANGRWIFTDKRPLNLSDDEYISVEYKNEKRKLEPRIYVLKKEGRSSLIADNPYHAPVEFLVKSSNVVSGLKTYIVPAASQKILFTKLQKIGKYKYHWRLGDPSASEDDYLYKFPVSSKSSHKITQAFHGKFSHSKQPSMFAVDVALPMRTNISAARSGVVIWVKDDYHMGGKSDFFRDKANYVKVLHRDGTYATYAHILAGTAAVKPGDVVQTGDLLAKSGSSGYSTGPHLHFVIRKNSGFKTISTPFRFIANDGEIYTPKKGMVIGSMN